MTKQERIENTLKVFREYVSSKGHLMTPDLRVREKVAADLIGIAPKTLRTMRGGLQGPAFVKMAGTVWYRLQDIAAYVETARCETLESALEGGKQ